MLLSGNWIRPFRRLPLLLRFLLATLLGFGLVLTLLGNRATAAQTVVLQHFDRYLIIPLAQLQSFVKGESYSPELQSFLAENGYTPAEVREWLSTDIPALPATIFPEDFILYQANKTLGDRLGQQDLDALKTALSRSTHVDQTFSILEVMEEYPKADVRLTLHRLERAYNDINLILTRVEPLLQLVDLVLPEIVCDCGRNVPLGEDGKPLPTPTAYEQAHGAMGNLLAIAPTPPSSPPTASTDLRMSQRAYNPDKNLVFVFGPFRPSITVGELVTFAETGELSRGWRNYLRLAGVQEEELRAALTSPIAVDLLTLDKLLNTMPGEFLLYEVGQVVQTPQGSASIEALRSAVILSVADDNALTMLELLQNYPTSQIQVNGTRLARIGKRLSSDFSLDETASSVLDLEGWLVRIKASEIEDLCRCEDDPFFESFAEELGTPPAIAPQQAAQFLPANWQPVPSHREDRGIIKIVWLQGTPYDMGYQHGQLLHDEIASLGKDVIQLASFIGKGLSLSTIAANRTYPNFLEECQGLVDATQDIGITMDVCAMMAYADVFQEILGYTLPREMFWDGCNQLVATGNATVEGHLYHGSSVDNDEKPVSYVINNPVIFVRQPNEGLPHVFVTYPGVIWPNSGMNVAGISLGLDTAHPRNGEELNLIGRSNVQIMAKILQNATSFADARSIMESQPRVRANLIMITDGKSQEAGVFEFTGKSLGVRELQDNGVLYVTNHMVLPEMHEKQALPLDPSSVSRFDRFQQLLEPGSDTSYYGRIDEAVMARVLRDRTNPYTGESSPPDLFDDDASPGGNGALRQAIYEPEALRMWVAAGPPPVPENPFVCFSVGELLGFPDAAPCEAPSL